MRIIIISLQDKTNPVAVGDKKAVFSFLNKKTVEYNKKKCMSIVDFDDSIQSIWKRQHELCVFYKWCLSAINNNIDKNGDINPFKYDYDNQCGWSILCQEVDLGEF